ncbi:hypothetical protein NDU88_003319 [Pleurodeles waltl]|uniref:Uncharacterized protein n=1 Tax=Pleurodeles waltl TaxID=8319 RepID=A0AAV7V092_PLEWA|nr:hypothetical protein NDU88_003319 [Pleurodeles waltl]
MRRVGGDGGPTPGENEKHSPLTHRGESRARTGGLRQEHKPRPRVTDRPTTERRPSRSPAIRGAPPPALAAATTTGGGVERPTPRPPAPASGDRSPLGLGGAGDGAQICDPEQRGDPALETCLLPPWTPRATGVAGLLRQPRQHPPPLT